VYSEKDNLLLPQISSLAMTEDKLWIGFSHQTRGGIGYLDLRTRKFVGLTPNLNMASLTNRVYPEMVGICEMPPRCSVRALYATPSDELWFFGYGVHSYSDRQKQWSSLPGSV